jgi:WD40 repeat protein
VLCTVLLFPGWLVACSQVLPIRPRTTVSPHIACGFVCFSPDGRYVVTAGEAGLYNYGPLQVWDAASGRQLLRVAGMSQYIQGICFSPDSKLLAAYLSKEDDLKLWDIRTAKQVFSLKSTAGVADPMKFRFSQDAKYLLVQRSGGHGQKPNRVQFWEIAARQQRGEIEANWETLAFIAGGQELITWQRDEEGKPFKVECWHLGGEPFLCPAGKYELAVDLLALSPYRKTLATISYVPSFANTAVVELRELKSGRVQLQVQVDHGGKQIESLSFSPNGRVLIVGVRSGRRSSRVAETRFWDVSQGPAKELPAFSGSWLIFSPDGRWLAVPTARGAELYDAVTMRASKVLEHPNDPPRYGCCGAFLTWVDFSPDGRWVAVSGLWPVSERNPMIEWFSTNIYNISAPVAVGSGSTIRLWDVETGQECMSFDVRNGQVKYSPDARTLAVYRPDKKCVEFWDMPPRRSAWMVLGLPFVLWLVSGNCLLRWQGWLRRRRDQRKAATNDLVERRACAKR